MVNGKWQQPKGPKPTHKTKNNNTVGLGKGLINSKLKKNQVRRLPDGEIRFANEDEKTNRGLIGGDYGKDSVTHETAINEFLNHVEMQQVDFETERSRQIRILGPKKQQLQRAEEEGEDADADADEENEENEEEGEGVTRSQINSAVASNKSQPAQNIFLLSPEEELKLLTLHSKFESLLTIPRRPAWTKSMSAKELQSKESESFINWRRGLALLQEGTINGMKSPANNPLLLTPFERNLEIWRQLWRVVERSQLIVQIVDARNPWFFRCKDLDKYVLENSTIENEKKNLLLINKSDYLTKEQRKIWSDFLKEQGVRFVFFSAKIANKKLEEENESEFEDKSKRDVRDEEEEEDDDEDTRILSIGDLENLFISEAPKRGEGQKLEIGLVGYPNVGKSSTINALIGSKKVSVSATPGKTKHFQTILLTPTITLCDCPGLVFPNFSSTDAELVCNGILPIDQLREHTGPTELVCQRIPKFFLEAIYGITINTMKSIDTMSGFAQERPNAEQLLSTYARARGFMRSGFGAPDESRAARVILKDYVNGKLLHCAPPPSYEKSTSEFNKQLYDFSHLDDSRKEQIRQAAAEKGVRVEDIDLSSDLAKLTFSQHRVGATTDGDFLYDKKDESLGSELDKEFFSMGGFRGVQKKPKHLAGAASTSKKHNKKRRHVKVRNAYTE